VAYSEALEEVVLAAPFAQGAALEAVLLVALQPPVLPLRAEQRQARRAELAAPLVVVLELPPAWRLLERLG